MMRHPGVFVSFILAVLNPFHGYVFTGENPLLDEVEIVFNKPTPFRLVTCKRNDPRLNECIKYSIEHLKPVLSKGVPELGIQSCDPLEYPDVKINLGNQGPASVELNYKQIIVRGLSDFNIQNVRVELPANRATIKVNFPRILTLGNYSIGGRILSLSTEGNGSSIGNFSDVRMIGVIEGKHFAKGGKRYFNVENFKVNLKFDKAHIKLRNVFTKNNHIGSKINKFMNDHMNTDGKSMVPLIEKYFGSLLKKIANKFFHMHPIDDLLL